MRIPFTSLEVFLTSSKSPVPVTDITPLVSDRGWFDIIKEPFTGAWQRNMERRPSSLLSYSAVYACITLIASDISKMAIRLVEMQSDGIWNEVNVASFSPVLRKPNQFQTRIKFIEQWMISKLTKGNTYVLKERDKRGVVVALYILHPDLVKPLVSPSGDVYYQLSRDDLAGVEDEIVVPASEIIHDTMTPLFHPLCGVSPLVACGIAATQGLSIQAQSTRFFQNGAAPSGIITAPGTIDDVTAERLKKTWSEKYSGDNAGKVAVLGDGLKFEKISMTAAESQMIEQLKWTAEVVCSCFHVPAYMIGAGSLPSSDNVGARNQQYYSQCLQSHIESIELLLDEGLGLTQHADHIYGTEFDLDGLLRMDTSTQYQTYGDGISNALLTPNEARKKIGLKALSGGDTAYMQQQNFSLAALDKRDSAEDPFSKNSSTVTNSPEPVPPEMPDDPPTKDLTANEKAYLAARALRIHLGLASAA